MSKMTRNEIAGLLNNYEAMHAKNVGKPVEDAHAGLRTFRDQLRREDGTPSTNLRAMAQVCKHYHDELKGVRGIPADVVAKTLNNAAELSASLHAVMFMTAGNVSKAIKGARRMTGAAAGDTHHIPQDTTGGFKQAQAALA